MKKTIVALLICVIMPATAGTYEYETNKREICSMMGFYAAQSLRAVKAGGRPPLEGRNPPDPIMQYIEKEVTTNTAMYDEKSAHMMGWSNCMDNIDRLTREKKSRS